MFPVPPGREEKLYCQLSFPRLHSEIGANSIPVLTGCAHLGHLAQVSTTIRKQIHDGILPEASEINYHYGKAGEGARALPFVKGEGERGRMRLVQSCFFFYLLLLVVGGTESSERIHFIL